ncbi:MAG: hypothetical protein OEY23_12380 [Acidimicrobiia bacterium]|nr:hypothetical protein [Acidimicrobiia bacterium]
MIGAGCSDDGRDLVAALVRHRTVGNPAARAELMARLVRVRSQLDAEPAEPCCRSASAPAPIPSSLGSPGGPARPAGPAPARGNPHRLAEETVRALAADVSGWPPVEQGSGQPAGARCLLANRLSLQVRAGLERHGDVVGLGASDLLEELVEGQRRSMNVLARHLGSCLADDPDLAEEIAAALDALAPQPSVLD